MMECSNVGKKKRGKGASLYGAIIENADYMLDVDLNNQKRKRVRVDVDDSRCDETYLSFLTDLEGYLESRVEGEDDDDDDDEEEEDPIYVKFLENLEEYGKCYMLGVSLEHGVRSPIMYEVEDDPSAVPERESPRSRRGVCNRTEGRSGVDRQMKSRRKDSSNKNERREGVKKYGLGSEAEKGSFDVNANEGSRSNHRYNMRKRRGLEVHEQSKSYVTNSNAQKGRGVKAYEKSKSGMNRRSKLDVNEDEGDRSQEIRRKSSRTSKSGGDAQEERARETDETYKSFNAGTKVVEDLMVCEFSDHQQVVYDGSFLQTPTEAKIEAASQQPTHAPAILDSGAPTSLPTLSFTEPITTTTPVSPTVNNNSRNSPVTDKNVHNSRKESREDHSNHWRKLRGILLKPFDQNELNELWNDMSSRSLVQIYRESRSGGTYKPGHRGKSYLDRYPELKDEIKKVESDSLKVLNLLRMLSFYLKMVPHGIPKPWLPDYRKMFFT